MAPSRSYNTGSSSPNAILVVFLVFFIIAALAEGGFIYMQLNERHDERDAKAEKADLDRKVA
jgi:hypothetical protein